MSAFSYAQLKIPAVKDNFSRHVDELLEYRGRQAILETPQVGGQQTIQRVRHQCPPDIEMDTDHDLETIAR